MTEFSKDDKAWINGWFEGNYSGKEEALIEMISYFRKKLKKIRKVKMINNFEAKNT